MPTLLRKVMSDQKVCGKELSDQTGIGLSTIYKISCGAREPSVSTAKKIAAALGFDWTKFYEEEQPDV